MRLPVKLVRERSVFESERRKGFDALARELERHVFLSLVAAKEQGEPPIQAVRLTEPFSDEDRRGWDIVIELDGVLHPLQVKSSEFGARKFIRRGQLLQTPIPVIVASLHETYQEILDKIGKELPFLRGFKLEKGKRR